MSLPSQPATVSPGQIEEISLCAFYLMPLILLIPTLLDFQAQNNLQSLSALQRPGGKPQVIKVSNNDPTGDLLGRVLSIRDDLPLISLYFSTFILALLLALYVHLDIV